MNTGKATGPWGRTILDARAFVVYRGHEISGSSAINLEEMLEILTEHLATISNVNAGPLLTVAMERWPTILINVIGLERRHENIGETRR